MGHLIKFKSTQINIYNTIELVEFILLLLKAT